MNACILGVMVVYLEGIYDLQNVNESIYARIACCLLNQEEFVW